MRRRLIVVFAAIAAVGGGVATASVLVPQPGSDTAGGSEAVQPDGGAVAVHALAKDPDGGPQWGVRIYRSQSGNTCPEAGRVSGTAFGTTDDQGGFTSLPVAASGSCADLSGQGSVAFAINRYPARGGTGARSVLFGTAPGAKSVTFQTDAGQQALTVAGDGAFLNVQASETPATGTLVVINQDGTEKDLRVG